MKSKFFKTMATAMATIMACTAFSAVVFAQTNITEDTGVFYNISQDEQRGDFIVGMDADYMGNLSYSVKKYTGTDSVVNIPEGIKIIGANAFQNNQTMTEVHIPNSVEIINSNAFEGCSSLNNVVIPDSVMNIGTHLFLGCDSLTNLTISKNITGISPETFIGNPWWEKNFEKQDYRVINNILFSISDNMKKQATYHIPEGVTKIDDSIFSKNNNMQEVYFPKSLISIGDSAFRSCKHLKKIHFQDGLTEIERSAFADCITLNHVVLPDTVKAVGWLAFDGCDSLTDLTIFKNATEIGTFSFSGNPWWKNTFKGKGYFIINNVLVGISRKIAAQQILVVPQGVKSVAISYRYAAFQDMILPPSVQAVHSVGWENYLYNFYAEKGTIYAKDLHCEYDNLIYFGLNTDRAYLSKGETFRLALNIPLSCDTYDPNIPSPDKDYSNTSKNPQIALNIPRSKEWKTSNNKVATVDKNGKVTAKGYGTAKISTKLYGKTYSCKVTVHKGGFITKNKNTYYLDQNGKKITGFKQVSGKKYYFDKYGVMVKSKFIDIGEDTYYFGHNGYAYTGLRKNQSGKQYYFHNDCTMAKNEVIKIKGKNYYFQEDGSMLKSKFKSKGYVYYFGKNGAALTGLHKTRSGYIYYFDEEGRMEIYSHTIDGKEYYFHDYWDKPYGAAHTGWKKWYGGDKSYYHKDGAKAKNELVKIDGKYYYFDKQGIMQKNLTKTIKGKKYHFGPKGYAI